jgi:mannose/fructose-specific phosphotransferase system component IIA
MSDTATKPRAIVIGHGEFAAGMLSAVEKITGQSAALLPLSVQDRSLQQIEEWLRAHLGESGAQVIFTDLQAGSASMAARRALRDSPSTVLVVGANLPMLLDFVMSDAATPVDAAAHAAERGRQAIVVHGGAA